jgi:hypothetical protein
VSVRSAAARVHRSGQIGPHSTALPIQNQTDMFHDQLFFEPGDRRRAIEGPLSIRVAANQFVYALISENVLYAEGARRQVTHAVFLI